MKLSRFITEHMEEILNEWDAFAQTLLPAAADMSSRALRDHARQILQELTVDIDTKQSALEQTEKSKGMAMDISDDSAAATHGELRHLSGFSLLQLTSEYRALRATVLRLWLPHVTQITEITTRDMVRFNEAIDQGLAESVVTYSESNVRTRDTFLAILGHDLRSPLAAMAMAGHYLALPGVGTEATLRVGSRVKRSAATMTAMVNDMLEYARGQLGGEMPIAFEPADLQDIFQASLHDARAVHPECPFELSTTGDLSGSFDSVRLQQVFTNLLNNAAQYRGKEHPVTILAEGKADTVTIQVKNFGPAIPPESLQTIFQPLVQLSVEDEQVGRPSTSLGLGLFIAREITLAHGGTISATSDETNGTVMTVQLPRARS